MQGIDLPLGIDESRIVKHALGAPAAIGETFEEDGLNRQAAEDAAISLESRLAENSANVLRIESDLERDVLFVALTESTFMADSSVEEKPIVHARLTKAINSLEAKITAAFGRLLVIAERG